MAGTPLTSGKARVFLIEGRARGDHAPSYEYQLRVTGPAQNFGDITRIQEPSPDQYDTWNEVGEIRGASERATTTLEGHYARDVLSKMLAMARKRCAFDIQLHFGACQDPRNFNDFDKIMVFEKAFATNWSAGDLGALQSDDNAMVDETMDLSAKDMYEIVPIGYGVKAGTIVTNEIVDVKVGDAISCGECETESDGCFKIYAVTKAAGGSPSTPSDVVFSIDKGVTWYAHDVDSMGAADEAKGIDIVGQYVVVVSNATGSYMHYALKSEFDGVADPAFTSVITGFVAAGKPNSIFSVGSMAFIVGDNGYIYLTTDPTSGVTVLDAGTITTSAYRHVYAFSMDFAVAVGDNGVVAYTSNGENWSAAPTYPVGAGVTLNTVFVKSKTEWWVGSSAGRLYYTLNGGQTWTEKAFPGSGSGQVYDIEFSTDSVGWLSHATATPAGRILRSYDGGQSWNVTPESSAILPANDRVNALGACYLDPNFIVGGGLADDGNDGYLVVGSS